MVQSITYGERWSGEGYDYEQAVTKLTIAPLKSCLKRFQIGCHSMVENSR